MQQWNQNIEIPTECHTGRSLNNTLNTSLCCQTPQEFTFVPLLYFLRKILIVSRCCRKGSAMIWPVSWHPANVASSSLGKNTPPHYTWHMELMLCVILDGVPDFCYTEFDSSANYDRLLKYPHFFEPSTVFFHISLKLDIDHAWGQICPAPCQLGWLDKQTGSVSKLPTAKGFWEQSLHSLAWWSGFMSNVSVIHTQRHANSSLTPEGSCKTPRAESKAEVM